MCNICHVVLPVECSSVITLLGNMLMFCDFLIQLVFPPGTTTTQDLTLQNAHEYIELVQDFCMNTGIRKQLDAFKRKLHFYVHA